MKIRVTTEMQKKYMPWVFEGQFTYQRKVRNIRYVAGLDEDIALGEALIKDIDWYVTWSDEEDAWVLDQPVSQKGLERK
jgi:hypothetical protein